MKKYILFLSIFFINCSSFLSQDNPEDLLGMMNEKPKKEYSSATFKTTRLINFHTVEVLSKRCLDFRIAHRFGDVNGGAYTAWGLDGGANVRLSLEYCHDGRLLMGIGRTSQNKMADGFLKYRLLRQTTNNSMPVSVTLFTSIYHTFERVNIDGINKFENVSDRLSYCHQIIVARKFSPRFSLQFLGAVVHYNLVENSTDKNDCYVAGAVLRYKFSKRQAITVEYGYRLNKYTDQKLYDSFGIGYDLETGGHVFQMHFTNSMGLTENQYFMYTKTTWENWGIRLGFNISRVFSLKGRNKNID